MAKRVIKKKPSRIRYEQAHPTVSFRITRPTYERLKTTIGTLGQSFADRVKDHLYQDDQRTSARAETLARHRESLGRDIEQKQQILDRQIAERQQQLKAPFEEEKARKLKEAERWGEDLKASYQFALLDKQAKLDRLQTKQWEREKHLVEIEPQIKEATGVLEMTKKQQAALEATLAQKVMEECRKRPEVFRKVYCEACIGYGWVSMTASLAQRLSRQASGPPEGASTKPAPAAHN